eukprot:Hpha_TRINITY_DN10896_c0_g1::TRINITY_DN10896_c0_g1_i1::g.23066::m.23066
MRATSTRVYCRSTPSDCLLVMLTISFCSRLSSPTLSLSIPPAQACGHWSSPRAVRARGKAVRRGMQKAEGREVKVALLMLTGKEDGEKVTAQYLPTVSSTEASPQATTRGRDEVQAETKTRGAAAEEEEPEGGTD